MVGNTVGLWIFAHFVEDAGAKGFEDSQQLETYSVSQIKTRHPTRVDNFAIFNLSIFKILSLLDSAQNLLQK